LEVDDSKQMIEKEVNYPREKKGLAGERFDN